MKKQMKTGGIGFYILILAIIFVQFMYQEFLTSLPTVIIISPHSVRIGRREMLIP